MNPEQTKTDNDVNTKIPTSPLPQKASTRKGNWWPFLGVIALLILSAAGAYQYQENKNLHFALMQQRKKLEQVEAQALAEHTRLQSTFNARLGTLEKTTRTLSTIYQTINHNELQRLLTDTEHTLAMASEALFVTNDISAALKLLQYADSKIQGVRQPEIVKLHAALQKDIQTLSALPQIDMAQEMARIDTLLNGIDTLPLNIDIEYKLAQKLPPLPVDTYLPWWKALGQSIWHELKALVSIRRLDKPEQALLSIDQLMLLRENMKLRMVSARIALMTRNQAAFKSDLQAVQKYLHNFFDQGQVTTKQFGEMLQKLLAVQLVNDKPVFTSLDVLRNTSIAPEVKEGEQG